MDERGLFKKVDFRRTVPYAPNSEPINCRIILREAMKAKDIYANLRCSHPDIICPECPLAQKITSLAELLRLYSEMARATYGLDRHSTLYGSGQNLLRTAVGAQPSALRVGDILATGGRLLTNPREGVNGAVWLHFRGGWIDVPSRIPIALQEPFVLPTDLKVGNILLVGDKVLANPAKVEGEGVSLLLTGGFSGHSVMVPIQIPIALAPTR